MKRVTRFPRARRLTQSVASACVVLALSGPAAGLDFTLEYETLGTTPQNPPSSDPDGTRLGLIMESVAARWGRIIDVDETRTLRYSWTGDLPSGTLAIASSSGFVRVNRRMGWFFDPTPDDNVEFDMQQALYKDVSSGRYRGNLPDVLEVGYLGDALPTASFDARERYDLLSVLMHEVGHVVGVGAGGDPFDEAFADEDYDFDPTLIGGQTGAVRIPSDRDTAHLRPPESLMNPTMDRGVRKLVGAVDAFAAEAARSWGADNINLFRKDIVGDQWNQRGDWIGNRVPTLEDQAFVRHGETITLTDDGEAGTLLLETGSAINVGSHALTVATTFHNTGQLNVTAGQVTAQTLSNQDDGNIIGDGTLAADLTNAATLDPEGSLLVDGDLTQTGAATLLFSLRIDDATGNDTHDWLGVTGDATLAGRLELLLTGDMPSAGDWFDLFDFQGTVTGAFHELTLPNLAGLTWDASMLATSGMIGVIPEPASLALLGAAGVLGLMRPRRR